MERLPIFEITFGTEKLSIPREANEHFFEHGDVAEKIKNALKNSQLSRSMNDVSVRESEIEIPSPGFDRNIFKCLQLDVLCFVGFGYPRHYKGHKILHSCWITYEFGNLQKNENHFYNSDGTLNRVEKH